MPIKETTHYWPYCLIDEDVAEKHHSKEYLKCKMETKRTKLENIMDFPCYSKSRVCRKSSLLVFVVPLLKTMFSHRVMIFPPIKVSEKCDILYFLSSSLSLLLPIPFSSHFPPNFFLSSLLSFLSYLPPLQTNYLYLSHTHRLVSTMLRKRVEKSQYEKKEKTDCMRREGRIQ